MGFGAVYRVSASLFLFFLIHFLAMFSSNGLAFHSSRWLLKIGMLISFIILSFIVHDAVFDVYATIARFVSFVFLLLQIIVLIDFAYSWNENWMAVDKEWKYRILACCFVMIAASIVLWVFSFQWFTNGDCTRNKFFIGWTITMTLIFTFLSITEKVEHGALLPSAVVSRDRDMVKAVIDDGVLLMINCPMSIW